MGHAFPHLIPFHISRPLLNGTWTCIHMYVHNMGPSDHSVVLAEAALSIRDLQIRNHDSNSSGPGNNEVGGLLPQGFGDESVDWGNPFILESSQLMGGFAKGNNNFNMIITGNEEPFTVCSAQVFYNSGWPYVDLMYVPLVDPCPFLTNCDYYPGSCQSLPL